MSLGIGGATPFAMKSYHHTALNHSFRDTSGYDPSKQTKVKCSFCGCWAKKGSFCYQCKRPVGGGGPSAAPYPPVQPPSPRPSSSSSSRPLLTQQRPVGGRTSTAARPSTAASTRSGSNAATHHRVPDNALQHQFRETSSYDPSARLKVKCSFCGCWSHRGAACYFCKTFNH